jgi:DivIVA domain-containing protein
MTPVEIRHVQLGRSLRGYKRELVDRLLTEVADSFEDVWRERADLADKVEQLELDLVRHKELEGLLRTTLVSAESASQQLREQARKERRRSSARRTPKRARSRAARPPRKNVSTPSSDGSSRCCAPRSTASTTRPSMSGSPSGSPPARSAG